MEQTAGVTGPASARERSAGELVKELTELVPRLVRDELKLAQVEMTQKGKQMGIGAGAFAGSGVIALYAVGCLLACGRLSKGTPPVPREAMDSVQADVHEVKEKVHR